MILLFQIISLNLFPIQFKTPFLKPLILYRGGKSKFKSTTLAVNVNVGALNFKGEWHVVTYL